MYPCFKILMEFFDLINGVKEDKYLRIFLSLLVNLRKDSGYDVLMHFCLVFHDFVVIFDTFQGHPFTFFTFFLLDHLIDVELDHIFNILLIKLKEFFLHGG